MSKVTKGKFEISEVEIGAHIIAIGTLAVSNNCYITKIKYKLGNNELSAQYMEVMRNNNILPERANEILEHFLHTTLSI